MKLCFFQKGTTLFRCCIRLFLGDPQKIHMNTSEVIWKLHKEVIGENGKVNK